MDNLIRSLHYLPIITTVISVLFTYKILARYQHRPGAYHLLWWGLGVAVYGLGTLTESIYTLTGWSEITFKLWYISGALLGGGPLALGSVYLLKGKKWGHTGVVLLLTTVSITSIFVYFSPINLDLINPQILNADVLRWQPIRLISPFINGFAAIFLIGGAIYSAMQYRQKMGTRHRFIGNVYIAIGAILPGIGGGMSRGGITEALYIGELLGLILIWIGYQYCQSINSTESLAEQQLNHTALSHDTRKV